MQFSNPELKKVILNIITFLDDVNNEGQILRRIQFKREYIRGVAEIRRNILNGITVITKESNNEFIPIEEAIEKKENIIAEKYSDEEIELSDNAFNALKFYYNEREYLPEMEEYILNLLDELVKD